MHHARVRPFRVEHPASGRPSQRARRPPRRLLRPAPDVPTRRSDAPASHEEFANALSHGVGVVAALCCLPLLAADAFERRDAASISAALVFGPITVMLYAASTMLHSVPPGRWQRLFAYLDHSAIFLMIAGTYTPFTLGVLRGRVGWSLLIAVWGLAAYGIYRTLTGPNRPKFIYLAMGWLVVLAIGPLVERMALPGLALVVAGGMAYTTGFAFYVVRELPYSHLIWHLFVLLGTACHFFAVRGYAA